TTISFFIVTNLFAQEPSDALRYSWLTQSGTARNQAIGGASASLGGEFSTLFINPAGLGFYKNDELVLTPGFNLQKNKSIYKGTSSSVSDNNFNYGATGAIFSLPAYRQNANIRNITVGIGLNRAADFDKSFYYKGT